VVADLFVMDTHTLLWYMDADPRLGSKAKAVLDDPSTNLALPAIALAEALFILEFRPRRHRIGIAELLRRLEADNRIAFAEATQLMILKTLDCIPITEMHDRQIVATALIAQDTGSQVTILTKDQNISQSGLVATLW
jgi:PIN domain nuclease of toxin-antitoxin system